MWVDSMELSDGYWLQMIQNIKKQMLIDKINFLDDIVKRYQIQKESDDFFINKLQITNYNLTSA